ncbi:MAG: hypothetical protein ACRCWR_07015 [Saezia sp.]
MDDANKEKLTVITEAWEGSIVNKTIPCWILVWRDFAYSEEIDKIIKQFGIYFNINHRYNTYSAYQVEWDDLFTFQDDVRKEINQNLACHNLVFITHSGISDPTNNRYWKDDSIIRKLEGKIVVFFMAMDYSKEYFIKMRHYLQAKSDDVLVHSFKNTPVKMEDAS